MSRNKEHRPNGAAAECGAYVFFISAHLPVLYYEYVWIFLIYSVDIPWIMTGNRR